MNLIDSDPYYTQDQLSRIESSHSFIELGLIGIEVLTHMHQVHSGETFHQVCGPLSTGPGTIEEKVARFCRAIQYHRTGGRVVFNQMPLQRRLRPLWEEWNAKQTEDPKPYCYDLLDGVYKPIFESGFVHILCFMPSWKHSIGTDWEHQQAARLGLEIEYMHPDWEIHTLRI